MFSWSFSGADKQWPVEHFRALAERLAQEPGARILLLWGPDEVHMARQIRDGLQARAILAPPTDLHELGALLTTRSAAYAFPSVILGLAWLSRTESPTTVRWLIFGICVLCFLTPSAYVFGDRLLFPMPMGLPPFLSREGLLAPLLGGW